MVPRRTIAWLGIAAFLVGPVGPTQGQACTLFAAAGESVQGGGTIIAKDRDWRPDNSRVLKLASPKAGHRYFGLEDFIRISEDRSGGPDTSLWREGSTPTSTRTLAAWIVYLPSTGEPQIYVKIANPDKAPAVHRLSFNDKFEEA